MYSVQYILHNESSDTYQPINPAYIIYNYGYKYSYHSRCIPTHIHSGTSGIHPFPLLDQGRGYDCTRPSANRPIAERCVDPNVEMRASRPHQEPRSTSPEFGGHPKVKGTNRMPSFAVQMFGSKDLTPLPISSICGNDRLKIAPLKSVDVSPSIGMSSINSRQEFLYNFDSANDDVIISR